MKSVFCGAIALLSGLTSADAPERRGDQSDDPTRGRFTFVRVEYDSTATEDSFLGWMWQHAY